MFEHKGIYLRKVSEDDLELLLVLKSESWFGTHNITIANMADQKRWFDSLPTSVHTPDKLFMMAEIDNNQGTTYKPMLMPVGTFKITPIDWFNRKAAVAWDVLKEYRGHGYGKKVVQTGCKFCFEVLNLHRLSADILVTNAASIKCAEAAGFKLEGKEVDSVLRNGKYIDSLRYGLIAN